MTQQVLIVDDDPVQRRLLEAQVVRMGYRAAVADTGAAALDALRAAAPGRLPAAILLDLVMPNLGGVEVMREMRRGGFDVPVIVQTAKGSISTVVEAMRAGAFDFVVKPAAPEKLKATIEQAVRIGSSRRRKAAAAPADGGFLDRFPEAGTAMRKTLSDAERAARSRIPVLIEGETGVGKEWLAQSIRASGPRAGGPFVVINCGAIPALLAESILFGHEKGAFTDASERRPGKFAEADRGTLFLDEVGELSADVQAKLLRVLQNGEVDFVGGRGSTRTDVRIISATNRDLAADVKNGRFREDLYYRLNVLPIMVPPLRQRREEIAPLARRFLADFAAVERPGPPFIFDPDVLTFLEHYDWPGNIRQLENAVHRAVVLADQPKLGIADFPQLAMSSPDAVRIGRDLVSDEARTAPSPATIAVDDLESRAAKPGRRTLEIYDEAGDLRPVDAIEADLIRLAMQHYGGHMSEVARRLGIGRSTLYRKLCDYKLAGDRTS